MREKFTIPDCDLEIFSHDRYHYLCPMVQKRIHVLVSKHHSGRSNTVIANDFGVSRNYVSQWINIYQKNGLRALYSNKYGTNKSVLEMHSVSLVDYFDANPPRTLKEVVAKIEALTGIKRSMTQVKEFLKRHDFRHLMAGQIPAKANRTQQVDWVEKKLKPTLEAAKKAERTVLFMDASHFVLMAYLCCLWSRVRKFIPGSAGRNRINVLGAIDAITKQVHTLINTTYITSTTVIDFFEQISKEYVDKKITIILDNARYQHCKAVIEAAKRLGIELFFLPTYSPNLNIIERLWKHVKKEILYSTYYETPDKFHKAINNYFKQTIHTFEEKEKLDTLITLKFQYFNQMDELSYAA